MEIMTEFHQVIDVSFWIWVNITFNWIICITILRQNYLWYVPISICLLSAHWYNNFFHLKKKNPWLRYILHTITLHSSTVYRSMDFSIFTGFYNHHHDLIWEHFHHPKMKPHAHQLVPRLPIFLPPSPSHLQPLIYSRSLCLPSLTEHVFKVHSCRSWYQHFTSFSHWIKFHCIEITHFVNPLIHWWAVGLFIL